MSQEHKFKILFTYNRPYFFVSCLLVNQCKQILLFFFIACFTFHICILILRIILSFIVDMWVKSLDFIGSIKEFLVKGICAYL